MIQRGWRALVTLLAVTAGLAIVAPGAAGTTGSESFRGLIVASGRSGERVVVTSTVVAKGVFDGVGRVVEIPNLPTDPDNVNRDDFVFADGTMHVVTTIVGVEFSVNPRSCAFVATVQQTGTITGGTGVFAGASGSSGGTVTGRGLLARNPDGSCSFEQEALLDVDTFASNGTLSF
jgi:hypothetical protein